MTGLVLAICFVLFSIETRYIIRRRRRLRERAEMRYITGAPQWWGQR